MLWAWMENQLPNFKVGENGYNSWSWAAKSTIDDTTPRMLGINSRLFDDSSEVHELLMNQAGVYPYETEYGLERGVPRMWC